LVKEGQRQEERGQITEKKGGLPMIIAKRRVITGGLLL
jgi:hypothetical protein